MMPSVATKTRGRHKSLLLAAVYFYVVRRVPGVLGLRFPSVAAWSQREMALCARYAAVLVAHRMKSNLNCSAAMRSC
jgi:hypothetical protein